MMIKDPRWAAINFDGTPASGAKLYIYDNGTDNLVPVYSDINMTVRATNPVVADGRGYFPVFYAREGTYKIKIETSEGALISEVSNVSA